jgi:flagellar hook-associated protein 2
MASITSMGLGSGLDIQSLVKQLVQAEGQATTVRLNNNESRYQAQLSAIGTLKGVLSAFQSSAAALKTSSGFLKYSATSGNTDVFTATADGGVPGSYEVEVDHVATAHKLASDPFTASTDTIGTGTLTFSFGDPTKPAKTVTIGSGAGTLAGIRDAVNNANIGVRASIVHGDAGFQLVFSSEKTGLDNAITVNVTDNDGNNTDASGLSQLASANMTEQVAAADALVYIDGVAVTRSSNTITDAIDGVTLTLKKGDAGATHTLTVAQDTTSAAAAVTAFVTAYNKVVSTFKSVAGYDKASKTGGILMGDASIRSVQSQLRNIIGNQVSGLTGKYTSMAEIGIKTQTDGTLLIDTTKLNAALADSPSAVSRIFSETGSTTDSLVSFKSSTAKSVIGTYAVEVSQLATQGSYTGAASTTTNVSATNKTFSIAVDGVTSGTITLTEGTYTGSQLAAQMQSRINGDTTLTNGGVSVTVEYVGGAFVVTSDRYGSASKVQFSNLSSTFQADFGIGATAGTTGVDVAGTLGGLSATGSGRVLTGDAGNVQGLAVEVRGGATGARGNVSFTRGLAKQMDTLLTEMLGTKGLFQTRTDGINKSVDDIGAQRERLAARLEKLTERYTRQFTAMDSLVSQLNSTSSYLTQQLSALSKLASSSGSSSNG